MSEKRKPKLKLLLKFEAKNHKVEFYDGELWDDYYRGMYRIRHNGKWFPEGEKRFFTKTQVRNILWRSLPL